MPVINGTVRRSRFTSLKIAELSSVDNPAQPGACMAIMKRHETGKAYDPNEPRDDHGRWTADGTGITGLPHMVEGVDEYGFIPTMIQNESPTAEYLDYSPGNPVGARSRRMYDAAHDQIGRSFQISPLESHAVLTSQVGRHIANEISVGDGPNELRAKVKAFARNKSWSKAVNGAAETFSNGEGSWPIGIERLARTHKVALVAKYICESDGAHTFTEVLAENEFSQNVWPCVDALSQSIRSIVGDASLTGGEREAKIGASVEQFLSSVRDISPEVSNQLAELCGKKEEGPMPKTIEELQADVTKLTGDVTAANTRADTEKARADKAETDLKAEQTAHGETKKALTEASDEVMKVSIDGTDREIKKSAVGDDNFAMFKAQEDRAETAQLEKRVGDEFRHVVGTPTEKAKVLKLVSGLPEDNETRKALEAILKSAEKMTASGFDRIGGSGGVEPTVKAAQSTFDQKVKDIAKRDDISEHQAMRKARQEFPTEFAAAYPDQAEQTAAN